jgi:hypothetical protein
MGNALNLILMCIIACELLILVFTLSRLQGELGERQEKLTSELSDIKKLLEK